MKEVEECPKCGYHGIMEAVGSMGTTQKRYICPECRHQFTK